MKKHTLLALALLASVTHAAQAEVKGTANFSTSYANVDNGYADGRVHSFGALLDVSPTTKLGFSLTDISAWGGDAQVLGLRAVHQLNNTVSVDASVAASNHGSITIHQRMTGVVKVKTLPKKNLVLGVGFDTFNMRKGGTSTALLTQAVYYVPGMPLVVQGDVTLSRSSVNSRRGYRSGVGATYGRAGKWTTHARYDTGRVHYELLQMPGAVADYHNWSASTGATYWVHKDLGLTAGVSRVSNRYFTRDEIRLNTFWNF